MDYYGRCGARGVAAAPIMGQFERAVGAVYVPSGVILRRTRTESTRSVGSDRNDRHVSESRALNRSNRSVRLQQPSNIAALGITRTVQRTHSFEFENMLVTRRILYLH
ncbi:hypothetical protein QE152_g20005 [Popillia japonica]|uniref:Uncharacterized protein n=1 Tax=Popillia japonica TaxID=7064 RepID=A0AAW1KNX4_POPJA